MDGSCISKCLQSKKDWIYLEETGSQIKVIFNVFKDIDLMFYKYYLGEPEAE